QTVSGGASSSRSSRIASVSMRRIGASVVSAILLLLVLLDQRFEAVEAHRPELLPLAEPPLGFLERLGFDPDEVGPALPAAGNQSRILEHLHVLGCAGKAHREGL